jgi:hypothetical protein
VVGDVTAAETKAKARQFATALTMHPGEIGRALASDQGKLTTLTHFATLPDNVASGDTGRNPLGASREGLRLKASPSDGRAGSAAKPGD